MEVGATITAVRRAGDRVALPLGIAGPGLVAWHNWRQWRADRGLLAQAGRTEGRPDPWLWPARPLVSALVAAWDEAELIERHIASFKALRYPRKELVLCAGGDDGTYELAARHAGPGVKVLRQDRDEGKQRALRRCLGQAGGEIIYLTDADCVLSDESFERALEPVIRGEAEVATGTSEPLAQQQGRALVQYQWFIDREWSARRPETADGVLGRNCVLTRRAVEAVGAFSAPAPTGTDYLLSRQLRAAGFAIRAVAASRVATMYPETAADYLRMWRRWNKNLLVHGLRFGAWGDVRGVVVAAVAYGAVAGLCLLGPVVGRAGPVAALLLFVVAGAGRARRVALGAALAQGRGARALLGTPFYTALDMLAVLLAIYDAARPGLRTRW